MKALRFAALLLPVAMAGCILTTGQFNIDVDLDDMFISGNGVDRELVDLNTNQDYVDHKDDFVGLADIGLTGTATNTSSGPLDVEVWITGGDTNYTTAAQVRSSANLLWGPFALADDESKRVTWDESAALFNALGKSVLINEMQGDGTFTIYAIRSQPPALAVAPRLLGSDVSITNAQLILTIEGED